MNTFLTISLVVLIIVLLVVLRGSYQIYKERQQFQHELKEKQNDCNYLTGTLDVANENSKRYQLICHILENQTALSIEIGYNGKLLTTALELDLVLDGIIEIHEQQQVIDILNSLRKGLG